MEKPVSALLCAVILLGGGFAARAAEPIRAMLLDGESAGPYHQWRQTSAVLKKEIEETGLFQVDVVTAPPSSGDFTHFKPGFEKYAVVISNLDSASWPMDLERSFERYMAGGGGLVVVHAADNAFPDWRAFNQMIGVGGWRGRAGEAGPHWFYKDGRMQADPTPGRAGSHGSRLPFAITIHDGDHPVTRGLPKVWMHAGDELYANLRGPGGNMTVLATAYSDPNNAGSGRDEPILMVLRYGKGRVFHTTLGHDVAALSCAGFIATFQRGAEWAATGKVTQQVPADFPGPTKVSTRPEIAAIGAAVR